MIPEIEYKLTAFIGPIGGPELIMILVVLVLLAIPIATVVILVTYFGSRNKPSQLNTPPASVQSRLAEIDALKSKNVITEMEYEEKRKKIIGNI